MGYFPVDDDRHVFRRKMLPSGVLGDRNMTMSLTIVNTSNWDGESYIINGQRIKPGEFIVLHPGGDGTVDLPIEAIHEDEKPFYVPCVKEGKLTYKQTWPEVTVTFRETT